MRGSLARVAAGLAVAAVAAALGEAHARADEAAPVAITHALVYVPGGAPPGT